MNCTFCCRILIAVLIVVFMSNHLTYADEWKDENTPISFKLEMLPWKEVDQLLPNKTIFTIIDVETGLQFKVQRRAGNQHADVQPLTREDTKIMKKIYNGHWSWKRKAIIVLANDQLIAASMNGMPHGAGALRNGFPGHFCVHFYGSITHRLKNEELAHKLMIFKASGKLDEYVDRTNPLELIQMFTVAMNQGDRQLLKLILSDSDCSKCLDQVLNKTSYFGVNAFLPSPFKHSKGLFLIEIPAQVTVYTKNDGMEKKIVHFIVRRESLTDRWVIDQHSLIEEFR